MPDNANLVKTSLESVSIAALLCFVGLTFAQTAVAPLVTPLVTPSVAPTVAPTVASSVSAAPAVAAKPLVANKSTTSAAEAWNKLTPAQKTALQPLYGNWASLSEGQKRKWIAVSANFAQFSEQDKTKLHSRMTDWSSLSVKQREQARINFAQTKTLTTQDKQAKWESYKALPPETKQALANIDVAPKPTGAATAAKPVAKDKLVVTKPNSDKATLQ